MSQRLHLVTRSGDPERLRTLLHRSRIEVDVSDETGITPLMLAAQLGSVELMAVLVAHGADVNAADAHQGWTPLMYAVTSGIIAATTWLLAHGAEVNATDAAGNTALHLAIEKGFVYTVEALLKGGADPLAPNEWEVPALEVAQGCRDRAQAILTLLQTSRPTPSGG